MHHILPLRLASLMLLLTLPFLAEGQTSDSITVIEGKRFHVHEVQKKETLFSLSRRYDTAIEAIREHNELQGKGIEMGQLLHIPAWDNRKGASKKGSGKYERHKVKPEETLFGIAQQYNVGLERLRELNPEVEKEGLEPGQKLKIPKLKKLKKGMKRHEVAKGETLFSLAQEYNTTVEHIEELNPSLKDGTLDVGQVLRIEPGTKKGPDERSHEVEAKETLFSISQQYHVGIEKLKEANPILKKEGLEVGQTLTIPKPGKIEFTGENKTDKPKLGRTHTVREGETLYSLSKQYNVPMEKLLKLNPEVDEGLKVGQELLISKKTGEKPSNEQQEEELERSFQEDSVIVHKVLANESLNTIAKQYGVAKEAIVLFNPQLWFREPHTGEFLLIPRFPSMLDIEKGKKEKYDVALFLPLNLAKNDTFMNKQKAGKEKKLYPPTRIAIEFYNGVRLALDSLKERGLSVDLHVLATKRDSAYMTELLGQEKMRKMDLFIGPFFSSNLRIAAKTAEQLGVHTVCPVPQSNRILLGNPNISKVTPSKVTQAQQLARFVAQEHAEHNVIMLEEEGIRGKETGQVFKGSFNKYLQLDQERYQDSISTVIAKDMDLEKLKKALKQDTFNVLVVPSSNKVFASNLMTQLSNLEEGHRIRIYGLQEWLDYESIDINYKQQFNLHIASNKHLDYENTPTIRMMREYRHRHNTDPGEYAFLGYDIGLYYFSGLLQYGTGLPQHFDRVNAKPLHLGFKYYKTGVESGYENQHQFILHYEDLELKRRRQKKHAQ